MPVALSCPHCQTQLRLNRQPQNKKSARCPMCKGAIPLTILTDKGSGTFSRTEKSQRHAAAVKIENLFAPPQQPDEIGRLGPYRVLSRIGSGGMGIVFRAEDPSLKRQVALKVMLPQYASNPVRKARFIREARAQVKVEHEHIVVIFQADEIDGVSFIAMPLLKGQSLFAALMQNPQPPLKEALRIGREMAEGLAAAHEAGLIHRDIKPSNVWLDGKRRRVKILDFGLARAADTTEVEDSGEYGSLPPDAMHDGALTVQGAIVGTPLYMSPEQARGEKADHRTDLFSLGVVLYQMATGVLPFDGPKTSAILDAVKEFHPPAPIVTNTELPQAVSDFIMLLLAKQVEGRPANAEEVVETLQKLESSLNGTVETVSTPALAPDDPWRDLDASEPITLTEASAPTPAETRPVKPRPAWKRRPILIGGAVLGIVVAAIVVGVFAFSPKRPPPQQPDPEPAVVKTTPTPAKPPVVKKAFAWPVEALREGRITQPDLSNAKLLKADDFEDRASGWPQGKSENKGAIVQRGYKDGNYFIRKEFEAGATFAGSSQFAGLSAIVCQVEGRVVDDAATTWDLLFVNDQQRKALTLKLNPGGKLTVAVTNSDNAEQEPLFSGTHAAIRKGNEFNRLTVIYTSDRLEVFANGVAVCDPLAVPQRLQPANIAFGISGGGKSTAEFRRLAIWSADGLPAPEERLKNHEVPVKDSFRLPFSWPTALLREGRVGLPALTQLTLLKKDEFKDMATGWPHGKSETKGIVSQRGYKDGTYFIRKEYNGGYSYNGSSQFIGFSNFVCQVEGRVVDDANSNWDLWFGSDVQRKAVIVRLNATGKLRAWLWDYDKGDQTLLYSGSHKAIARGNEFNKLSTVYSADCLEVFVNEIAVCDPILLPLRLQPVRIALGASGPVKCETEYRQLSIWSAEGLPVPEVRFKNGADSPK